MRSRIVFFLIFAGAAGVVLWLGLAALTAFEQLPLPKNPRAPEFYDVSNFAAEDEAKINVWLEEQVERARYPSLNVAIVSDGRIVYQGAFGFENLEEERRATPDTLYHVASVTKTFTASMAVMLDERGMVDLDDPVTKYLPKEVRISTTPGAGARITLRELASHTSGLPRAVPGGVQSAEGRYLLEPKRLYDQLARVKLRFKPGTADGYSNLGFGLLGHALERATGKSFGRLVREMVCDPLQLKRTAIQLGDRFRVAQGYATALRLVREPIYRKRLAGSDGLITTARDLAKFLAAQMKPGVFSRAALARLHTAARLIDGSKAKRGLGWSLESGGSAPPIVSKNGHRDICSAWIGFAPDEGVGVAVAANCGEPAVDEIGEWLLERSVPGGYQPVTKYGYAKAAPYTGVRWKEGRPIVRVQGRWSPLVSLDRIPIERIMKFARKEFGEEARERFAEDLVEVLAKMGHEPEWTVTLGLKKKDGTVQRVQAEMTEEKWARVVPDAEEISENKDEAGNGLVSEG